MQAYINVLETAYVQVNELCLCHEEITGNKLTTEELGNIKKNTSHFPCQIIVFKANLNKEYDLIISFFEKYGEQNSHKHLLSTCVGEK